MSIDPIYYKLRYFYVGFHYSAFSGEDRQLIQNCIESPSFVDQLRHYYTHYGWETLVLATCNRVDIVFVGKLEMPLLQTLFKKYLPAHIVLDKARLYKNTQALEHFLTVLTGLDSMIPGETEIVSQIKQAFIKNKSQGFAHNRLEHLLNHFLNAGKHIKKHIPHKGLNLASTTIDIVLAKFGGFSSVGGLGSSGSHLRYGRHNILITGSGQVASLFTKLLLSYQNPALNIGVASRQEPAFIAKYKNKYPSLAHTLHWLYLDTTVKTIYQLPAFHQLDMWVQGIGGDFMFDITWQSIIQPHTIVIDLAVPPKIPVSWCSRLLYLEEFQHFQTSFFDKNTVTGLIQDSVETWMQYVYKKDAEQQLHKLHESIEQTLYTHIYKHFTKNTQAYPNVSTEESVVYYQKNSKKLAAILAKKLFSILQ
jgi:glutamyl-tRNA reductase